MENLINDEKNDFDGFTRVCSVNNLIEYKGKRFFINDVDLVVFLLNGEIFALSNICPHQHTALIYDGFIEDGCVICPAHGWMFNLRTGRMPTESKGLDSYPVRVIDGIVYVKVTRKVLNW
ncbi:MAG: nitrite reductase (NAD(P)H) small subunit [Ignavibacteriaceae bacterium]|jgi:nitrite reductase/ring-hydroxylating ferredoxin subunit